MIYMCQIKQIPPLTKLILILFAKILRVSKNNKADVPGILPVEILTM